MEIEIRPFQKGDEKALADHLNKSDEAWPGSGFTHGVPLNEHNIKDWFENRNWEVFIAWQQQIFSGFVSISTTDQDPNIAYIPLINVEPAFHGQKIGKKLLKYAVDEVIRRRKFDRLDLHTWSANLKAVPLYKKMGFFWRPDTTVHMENYLPLLMKNPLINKFFADEDWYDLLQRELEVIEDKQDWDGLKCYVYRFSKGKQSLEVKIDRASADITYLAFNDLTLYVKPAKQNFALQEPNKMNWFIKSNQPRNIIYLIDAAEGLNLNLQKNIDVLDEYNDEIELSPSPEIELKDQDDSAHKITTKFIVDGSIVTFKTGVYLNQGVIVSSNEPLLECERGQKKEFIINIENKTDDELTVASKVLWPQGIKGEITPEKTQLKGKEKSSLKLVVYCEQKGFYDLDFVLPYYRKGQLFEPTAQTINLLSREPNATAGAVTEKYAYMTNDNLLLRVKRVGGSLEVFNKENYNKVLKINSDYWGPPYGPPIMADQKYDINYQGSDLFISAQYPRNNKLKLLKKLTLQGSEIYQHFKIRNTASEEAQIKLRQNIVPSLPLTNYVYFPVDGYLMMGRYDREAYPGYSNLVEDYQRYNDFYQIIEGQDYCLAVVNPHQASKVSVSTSAMLNQALSATISPYSTTSMMGPALYCGKGNKPNLSPIFKKMGLKEEQLKTKKYGASYFEGDKFILSPQQSKAKIHLYYPLRYRVEGNLKLDIPTELNAENVDTKISLQGDKPSSYDLALNPSADLSGVFGIKSKVQATGFNRENYLTVLIPSLKQSEINFQQKENLYQVDNGLLSFALASDFRGAMVSLKYKETEMLNSPYPEVSIFDWINPWYGGIYPFLLPQDSKYYPGYLHQEDLKVEQVNYKSQRGFLWQGLQLSAILKQQDFKGLQLIMEYLTLPFSSFIAIRYRLNNLSNAYFEVICGWEAFLNQQLFNSNSLLQYQSDAKGKGERFLGQRASEIKDILWCSLQDKYAIAAIAAKNNYVSFEEYERPFQQIIAAYNPFKTEVKPHSEVEQLTYLLLQPNFKNGELLTSISEESDLF